MYKFRVSLGSTHDVTALPFQAMTEQYFNVLFWYRTEG